jgi:hypothetical protein
LASTPVVLSRAERFSGSKSQDHLRHRCIHDVPPGSAFEHPVALPAFTRVPSDSIYDQSPFPDYCRYSQPRHVKVPEAWALFVADLAAIEIGDLTFLPWYSINRLIAFSK